MVAEAWTQNPATEIGNKDQGIAPGEKREAWICEPIQKKRGPHNLGDPTKVLVFLNFMWLVSSWLEGDK